MFHLLKQTAHVKFVLCSFPFCIELLLSSKKQQIQAGVGHGCGGHSRSQCKERHRDIRFIKWSQRISEDKVVEKEASHQMAKKPDPGHSLCPPSNGMKFFPEPASSFCTYQINSSSSPPTITYQNFANKSLHIMK